MATAAETFAIEGFGPENLPYASFSVNGGESYALGARLGNKVIDLGKLAEKQSGLTDLQRRALQTKNLDALLEAGHEAWSSVRAWLQRTVNSEESADLINELAFDVDSVCYQLAFTPADYVDFYASEHHAANLGKMFRPNEEPLKPNWKHLPVGYHGRSGTVVVSGTDIVRPKGLLPQGSDVPKFGATNRLDIEAEIGFVLGGNAPRGEVSVTEAADEYIFGVFLFNDWSARDIQNYEYVPLGPNLGKSFASSVGTWIVPWEALDHARVAPPVRDHTIADYLQDGEAYGGPYGLDITMGISVDGQLLSNPPFKLMYWTAPQMVAHTAVNGGSIRPGDMFGSGTVSGYERNQRGSFIELSWGGKEPLTLNNGTEMTFLQDGQTVTLTGTAPGPDGSVIDFGDCVGTIVPATEN